MVSIFSLSGNDAQDGHLAAGRNGVKRLRTVNYFSLSGTCISILQCEKLLFILKTRLSLSQIIKQCNIHFYGVMISHQYSQVRHPNILSFLHSTETEVFDGPNAKITIYIVTEPVMPLSEKINELGLKGTQRYMIFPFIIFK